jgi:hypothetical protein
MDLKSARGNFIVNNLAGIGGFSCHFGAKQSNIDNNAAGLITGPLDLRGYSDNG